MKTEKQLEALRIKNQIVKLKNISEIVSIIINYKKQKSLFGT